LHIDTAETTTTTAFDTLQVQIRKKNSSGNVLQTLATFSNLNHAVGLSAAHVQSQLPDWTDIQVFFVGKEDSTLQTSFVPGRRFTKGDSIGRDYEETRIFLSVVRCLARWRSRAARKQSADTPPANTNFVGDDDGGLTEIVPADQQPRGLVRREQCGQ